MTTVTTRTSRPVTALALAVTLGFGVPAFGVGSFFSYFMNDLPGGDDHIRFTQVMLIGALLAAATTTIALRMWEHWVWWRCAAFASGASIALNGAVLAFVFATSATDFGDGADTVYGAWTAGQVYAFAAACGTVGMVGLVVAIISARHRRNPDGA